jgi:cytochrome c553
MKRSVRAALALTSGLAAGLTTLSALAAAPAPPPPAGAGPALHFESKVRPLLLAKCETCHGPRLQQGGLRVDSLEALLRGGKGGPALVPGKPAEGTLIRMIRHPDASLRMPPGARLSDAETAALVAWVRDGAHWPSAAGTKGDASHWAFQPVRRPALPAVKNRSWVRTPIDAFVLAGLEAKGLQPSPPADPATLIRRAYFDLTGLPPTPGEVEAFVGECAREAERGVRVRERVRSGPQTPDSELRAKRPSPNTERRTPNTARSAYSRLIDRLLASPQYGEKWGRHWLDCVRYADSNGLDENYHYAYAWRYRDYVVDAFNRDLPYDQFLTEQLAGDLLPPSAQAEENYRRTVATGFYLLGPKLLANPDKVQVLADIIDEQIDVTSRAMLGVTLACARCHDHKFDPFSQKDYYAVAGIFRSTRSMINLKDRVWSERPLAPAEVAARAEAHQKALDEKKKELETARKSKSQGPRVPALEAEVLALEKSTPPPVPYALAIQDGEIMDVPLYVRGDHNHPGEVVRRGFPAVLAANRQPQLDPSRSGRLEMARWIASPQHPLTARVMVNRVWQWHFGDALVRTSDNFGALGEKPSNPAMLDWLAAAFTSGDAQHLNTRTPEHLKAWSLKSLHRLLMLSNAYQMSSRFDERAHLADPDNRLLWRMNRRRLTAEEQRDAMLAASGELDLTMGGSLLLDVPNKVRVTTDGSDDLAVKSYDTKRRSLYLPVIRNSLYEMLELFDFADASAVTTRRSETLASPQALFLLNHPFMRDRADRFARRLLADNRLDDTGRLRSAYLAAFGHPPTAAQLPALTRYLRAYAAGLDASVTDPGQRRHKAWQSLCHTLLCANEFLYVD